MKKQHWMLKSLVLVGALAGVLGAAQAQTPVVPLRVRGAAGDTQYQAAVKMNEVLKAKTNGALDLKIFTDSQLGTFQAAIAGVRGGTIDMAVSGSGNFTGLESMIGVFDIPYLFKDSEHAYKVLDGPVGHGDPRQAGAARPEGPRVLGQRLAPDDQLQAPDQDARGRQGPEDAHHRQPGAHRGVQGARRQPGADAHRRALHGAGDEDRRRARSTRWACSTRRSSTRCRSTSASPTTRTARWSW